MIWRLAILLSAKRCLVMPLGWSAWSTRLGQNDFGAELILFNVVEKFPIDYLLGRELTNETIVPMMKQAEADLKRVAASLSKSTDVSTSAIVRQGTPFDEICHAAKTLGGDMIVLTTHGYTGLKHVWLGSTAERVVISLYYGNRDRFIEVMRHAIALNASHFNTQRMVQEYIVKAYF